MNKCKCNVSWPPSNCRGCWCNTELKTNCCMETDFMSLTVPDPANYVYEENGTTAKPCVWRMFNTHLDNPAHTNLSLTCPHNQSPDTFLSNSLSSSLFFSLCLCLSLSQSLYILISFTLYFSLSSFLFLSLIPLF